MKTTDNDPISGGLPEVTEGGGLVLQCKGGGSITLYGATDSAHAPTDASKTNIPAYLFTQEGYIAFNDGAGWEAAILGDDSTDWPHWG